MSCFLSKLVVEASDDQRTATLVRPLIYESNLLGSDVIVPVGFSTDFASVPQLLWNIVPPLGRYGDAAIVHDYLYRTQTTDRATADAIFLEAMEAKGCRWTQSRLIYYAVRLFGWHAWRENGLSL
jgi:hypothetical protein